MFLFTCLFQTFFYILKTADLLVPAIDNTMYIASELKNGICVSEKNVVDVCVNFFALYEHTMSNQANEHASECVRKREFDGNTSASGYTWIFNMPIRAVCAY